MTALPISLQTPSGKFIERLSVFVEYSDEDGQIDFKSLSVIHKETGLTWLLPVNEVSFFTFDSLGKNSYVAGTTKIAPAFLEFPRGQYIATVTDLASQEHSISFTLNDYKQVTESPFEINVSNTDWRVKTKPEQNLQYCSLIVLGSDRQTIYAVKKPLDSDGKLSGKIKEITSQWRDARYIRFMFDSDGRNNAVLSDIFEIKSEE